MPSSFTDALGLEKQAVGEGNNLWGTNLNAVLDLIDDAVAARLSKSVAGGTDVTLTSAEARHMFHEYSGTLTASINVIVPAKDKLTVVYNNTSGAFTLTVKTAAGTGIAVNQGDKALLYCDGTNVISVLREEDTAGAFLTTRGDLLVRAASALSRLAIGGANTVLRSDGTDPAWGQVQTADVANLAITTALLAAGAVTGPKIAMGSDARGDVLFRGSSNYERLAAGTSGQALLTRGAGADPEWARPALRGHIDGLILSNNATDSAHDIDIAAGEATEDGNAITMVLSSALTKQLDAAWAVGTNQGGLDTGSIAASTWYHVWLIRRSDTGVVDVLFSTSATSPTMPTNYDQKRRIGAVLTNATPNIIAFKQEGDHFWWVSAVEDVNTTPPTTQTNYAIRVPLGVRVLADVRIQLNRAGANLNMVFGAPDETLIAPGDALSDVHSVAVAHARRMIRTDTSSQVAARADVAATVFRLSAIGWFDPRGRNA